MEPSTYEQVDDGPIQCASSEVKFKRVVDTGESGTSYAGPTFSLVRCPVCQCTFQETRECHKTLGKVSSLPSGQQFETIEYGVDEAVELPNDQEYVPRCEDQGH